MTTDDLKLAEIRQALARLEEDAIKPDADGYYDIEKIRAAIGVKQPIAFESPPQTFENPIGHATARDDLSKLFDQAGADFTPPQTAAAAWAKFCQRQDTLKLADLQGAIERFRDQRIARDLGTARELPEPAFARLSNGATSRDPALPAPALPKRQQIRNKYAARPPGKR